MEETKISRALVSRLPRYLAHLKSLPQCNGGYVSSASVANALGLGHVLVRKDFAKVSDGGHPKTGYRCQELIVDIEAFLGYNHTTDAILVGAGKLGQALLDYYGFCTYGINVMAGFDVNPSVSHTSSGKPILPMGELEPFCRKHGVLMGIITVPAEYAQTICDRMVASGIQAIWNFAPVSLKAPEHVVIQSENLASSLTVLRMQLKAAAPEYS